MQFHKQFRHENKSGQAATALPSPPASHSLSFSRICFLSLRTCELAASYATFATFALPFALTFIASLQS